MMNNGSDMGWVINGWTISRQQNTHPAGTGQV